MITEQFGRGMGYAPGFGIYSPYNANSMIQPNTGQNLSDQPAWIPRPGGGLVRNPDYNPPAINGWQGLPGGGLARPGVVQANRAAAVGTTSTPSGGRQYSAPVGSPGQPTQQPPPQTPTGMGNVTTDYGAGIQGNHITTGIQAGPIYSPQQQQAALQGFNNEVSRPLAAAGGSMMNIPMNPGQQADLAGRFQSGMGYRAQGMATDADRNMSYGNAQHILASQRARAQAGAGWGNLNARLDEMETNEELSRRNVALSLLAALGLA